MNYYAHTYETDESQWQPLREHLENVAKLARGFALEARPGDANFADAAYVAGLLHDLGKYRPEFQRMIRNKQAKGESTRHKQAGAAEAIKSKQFDISFSILGHHGGMPDAAELAEAVNAGGEILGGILPAAYSDCPQIKALPTLDAIAVTASELEIRTRLLFSCLVDADWLDTSAFHARKSGWPTSPMAGKLHADVLLKSVLTFVKIRAEQCRNRELARIRADILAAAENAAEWAAGVFSMTVPTGGGKTLSSLAFALRHAAVHGLRRVIYVAPYLSIIEQNAAVFRAALGEAAGELILEHHSLVEPGKAGRAAMDDSESDAAQRLAENWDAPIVLTTSVQFYESLFSNQPSRCRKMHNIARSVVILDECQTLPAGFTAPTCVMLEQASRYLGCSFVLCTATQPAWKRDLVRLPQGISEVREIAPDPPELFRKLKRVAVTWPQRGVAGLEWADVAAEMQKQQQVLCVVNTRRAALEIYRALSNLGVVGGASFHQYVPSPPAAHFKAGG